MLYVRTASGGFLNSASIVRLADRRGEQVDCWIAICADGEEIALAGYYSAPGRVERDLPHLVPSRRGACPAEACCGA